MASPLVVHTNTKHPKIRDQKIGRLSVPKLKRQIVSCWVRYEKAAKNAMAARLYYLREKMKHPGDRHDRGFNKWVEAHIGLSLSTVNRWADAYAIQQGFKQPRPAVESKRTSNQVTRGSKEQYPVHFVWTKKQITIFDRAWEALGDEVASQLVFDTVVQRAAKEKLKLKKEAA